MNKKTEFKCTKKSTSVKYLGPFVGFLNNYRKSYFIFVLQLISENLISGMKHTKKQV